MGHPGDSYVLRAGMNKDILQDIPTRQGGNPTLRYRAGGPHPCAGPQTKACPRETRHDLPAGAAVPQGGLLLLPSRFARSFGSRDKKFCSKVKGIGFLLHI